MRRNPRRKACTASPAQQHSQSCLAPTDTIFTPVPVLCKCVPSLQQNHRAQCEAAGPLCTRNIHGPQGPQAHCLPSTPSR